MKQLHRAILFIVCSMGITITAKAAVPTTFKCSSSTEVQVVNLGDPTVWIAPPVENARKEVGVGLGGKVVGAFIAAEPYQNYLGDIEGWYCIYETQNYSLHEYEDALRNTAQSVLSSYPDPVKKAALKKLNHEFNKIEESRQPFLKKYANRSVGFVRYRYLDPEQFDYAEEEDEDEDPAVTK